MLTKIIYKNFRSNLKNYILFFLSNIVAIMELFVFYGIRSIIKNSITDKVTAEALKTDFQIAVGIIAVITLMLMFYAMKCYIKLRIKDYSMFLILGMKYRDNLIVKLTKNQYMPYRFTLKEFYNFWLYYYIIDGCKYAYNTFKYYATPVKRFCEYFRPDTYMDSITTTDLKNFINKCETFSAYKAMMQMIQNSFQYAKNQQIIISNPAPLAIEICKKEKKITKPPTKKNAFTLNELMNLLLTARKMDYTFYLFLLLSASTGARVSETRAICFSKIDFQKKQLLIDCQLGRGYDNEGFDDNTLLSQKRTLKTRNSKRYVPLPDFIMDELYLARARYEETLKNDPEFDENLDFVLFRDHGKAIARPYYYFKKLMKKCNIDCTKHVWHDLRHTYATLLDQNNMNMKVVSEILGHYSEEFTNEVYVIHKPEVIIYDTSEVMNSFIESLKLDSTERTIPVYDISFIQEYLF